MAFQPKYLQPAEVDAICTQYLREIEAVALRENLKAIAAQTCGGDLLSMEHVEPLLAALEAERDRLKEGG